MTRHCARVIITKISIFLFFCLSLPGAFGDHLKDYDSKNVLSQIFDNHDIRGVKQQRLAQAGTIPPHLRFPQPSPQQPPAKPRNSSLEDRLLSNQHIERLQGLMRDKRIQTNVELRASLEAEIKGLLEERGRLMLMVRQLSETVTHLKANRNIQLQNFQEERQTLMRRRDDYDNQLKKLCRLLTENRWDCSDSPMKSELLATRNSVVTDTRAYDDRVHEAESKFNREMSDLRTNQKPRIIQAIVSWEAKTKDLDNKASKALESAKEKEAGKGETVYRVYGGQAVLYGQSWTSRNPLDAAALVPTNPNVGLKSAYRIKAGLPNSNTGRCLAIGTLEEGKGTVDRTEAERANPRYSPDPYDYRWQQGGWPELIISNPTAQIRIKPGQECIPVNF